MKNDWVLYDGDCSFCTGWARRCERVLLRRGFTLATLQSRNIGLEEMRVEMADGRAFGGADGVVQIARRFWWAWPLFVFAQIPGAMLVLRAGYRQFAANRHCLAGAGKSAFHQRHHATTTFFEMP